MKKLKYFGNSLLSRKLILAVVGSVVAFGNAYYNWGLTVQEVMTIITPLLGFILVEGYADAKERE